MPITSTYNTGTVSVASGSVTVTGVAVSWNAAAIREGDMFWMDGLSVRIAELVSNTELRLAHPWPGVTRTNHNYEIHFIADTQRGMATALAVLANLQGTGIDPLKNLTPAANRIAYYTSAGTAALTSLTAKARALLGRGNNAQIQSEIGLVPQANRYDPTATRVLMTGAFGLGSTAGQDLADIDLVTHPTLFGSVNTGTVAGTLPDVVGVKDGLLHIKINTNVAAQIYFSTHTSSPIYYRRSVNASTWQPWKQVNLE